MSKNKTKKQHSTEIPQLILKTAKFLEFISTNAATKFAARLFTTPIKHKMPNRELAMNGKSNQSLVFIPEINKNVMVYQYGTGSRKALLVHGWSGRGTQLYKIADELLKNDFTTISFDAPGHGKSPGNKTIMIEFIATILELEIQFGPFEVAIGHSLGGMSLINATSKGLKIKKLVSISAGNIIEDIIIEFIKKLKMKPQQVMLMRNFFEKTHKKPMAELSSFVNAQNITIPTLVVHDENDFEVGVNCAYEIDKHLKNSKLLITRDLGHRKILGDNNVIKDIIEFVN